jgi:hypothetical protein
VAVVVALGVSASAALADAVGGDDDVTVRILGGVTDDTGSFSPSLTPTFLVEATQPNVTMQCENGLDAPDEPCGTQLTTGCPAVQCWTWTPTLPGDGRQEIDVDYTDFSGISVRYHDDFIAMPNPPHTTVKGPQGDDDPDASGLTLFEKPSFDLSAPTVDESVENTFQCTLWKDGTAPGPWGSCKIPRLNLFGVYDFRARGVDIFGRVDPAPPPPILFSPTPCRVTAPPGVHTLPQIIKHGLKVTVTCIPAEHFRADLYIPLAIVDREGLRTQIIARVHGQTTKPEQTVHVTLRAVPHIDSLLFQAPKITIGVETAPIGGEFAFGAFDDVPVKFKG